MRYLLGITFGVVLGISFAPIPAHATHLSLSCGDIIIPGGSSITCPGTALIMSPGGGNYVYVPYSTMSFVPNYFTALMVSGSGQYHIESDRPASVVNITGTVYDQALSAIVGDNLYISVAGMGDNFTGTIDMLCIADTPGECPFPSPPPSPPSALGAQLAAASSTIQAITGVDIQSAEQWAGPHLLGVYAGSLIQTVYLYRGWIIVAAIIGALVWFVRRTYRFRKH